MKKFGKIMLVVLILALSMSVLAACGGAKKKTFEKAGIKITLTNAFYEKDVLTQTMYLESRDSIVGILKEDANPDFPISKTLTEYTELTLLVNNLSGNEVLHYSDEAVTFDYFRYDRTVSGKDFAYMGVTMKGISAFYLFNFACEAKNYESYEQQFLTWAKTIVII